MNAANLIDTLLARPQARWLRDTANGGSALATGIVVSMQELQELQAALPTHLQAPLWCLHVLGMDDVHPAPSRAHAEKAAAWHNEQFKDHAARLGISVEAKVAPWPHSAESHAADVADFIPQWLIPQWQLDALETKNFQTMPAVDLGTGIKAIADERQRQLQAEGFTRESDQQYRRGELAKAATAYVQLAAMDLETGTRDHIAWHGPAAVWPWAREWWKPVDARRDLVRAGALIAAQIDLIDSRAEVQS